MEGELEYYQYLLKQEADMCWQELQRKNVLRVQLALKKLSGEMITPAEEYFKDTGKTTYWQDSQNKPYRWWGNEVSSNVHD